MSFFSYFRNPTIDILEIHARDFFSNFFNIFLPIEGIIDMNPWVLPVAAQRGGDWEGGPVPPVFAKIDFPIRRNSNREWSRGGGG